MSKTRKTQDVLRKTLEAKGSASDEAPDGRRPPRRSAATASPDPVRPLGCRAPDGHEVLKRPVWRPRDGGFLMTPTHHPRRRQRMGRALTITGETWDNDTLLALVAGARAPQLLRENLLLRSASRTSWSFPRYRHSRP